MVMKFFLMYFLAWAVIGLGWILNIIDLVHSHAVDGLVIARGFGVFIFPLGSALGYFA